MNLLLGNFPHRIFTFTIGIKVFDIVTRLCLSRGIGILLLDDIICCVRCWLCGDGGHQQAAPLTAMIASRPPPTNPSLSRMLHDYLQLSLSLSLLIY